MTSSLNRPNVSHEFLPITGEMQSAGANKGAGHRLVPAICARFVQISLQNTDRRYLPASPRTNMSAIPPSQRAVWSASHSSSTGGLVVKGKGRRPSPLDVIPPISRHVGGGRRRVPGIPLVRSAWLRASFSACLVAALPTLAVTSRPLLWPLNEQF
jgi:hypothetical protein